MDKVEKILQEIFGYTDEQLLEEFQAAEEEWLQSGGEPPTKEEIEAALAAMRRNLR